MKNANIKENLAKLLKVKTLVTLILTGVFAYLSVIGTVDDKFLMIYTTIIAFYFGTQSGKVEMAQAAVSSDNEKADSGYL